MKIATIAEVLSIIDMPTDLGEFIEKEVLDAIGIDVALEWYHDAADKLSKCANNNRHIFDIYGKLPANICRFDYSNIEVTIPIVETKIGAVYFREEPKVSECFKTPSWGPNGSVTYCPWEVHVYKYLEA